MKNVLLASFAAFVLASGSALAADMGMPLKAPPAPPPAPSWTGCYVDAGVGYGMWNQDHFDTTVPPGAVVPLTASTTDGGRGWLGRVGGGCDYQFGLGGLGNWVIGAFGDYDFSDIHGTVTDNFFLGQGDEKQSHSWSAGGRIGYLVTPTLLSYFDGGYTEARFGETVLSSTFAPAAPLGIDLAANTYHGWFLGGGTEYAFTWLPIPGLFWRNEYRYAEYDAANISFLAAGVPIPGLADNSKKQVQTITTSVVWRFNWWGH